VLSYRMAIATCLLAVLYAVHFWLVPVDPLVRLYAPVLLLRALGIEWWFHRRELFQITLYLASAKTIVFFALVLAYVRPGATASTVVILELISEAVVVLSALFVRKKWFGSKERSVSKSSFGLWELLLFSWPFFLMSALNLIQGSSDVLLLKYFFGNRTVAEYDVGSKIGFLYFFAGSTVMQILRPKVTRLHGAGDIQRLGAVLRTASAMLLLLSGMFLLPSLYYSHQILQLLFGYDRDLSVFTFRWIALWISSSFLAMLCADTLLSLGQRRKYMVGAFLCAGINLATNFILLSYFPGHGAVIAKIVADAFFACYAYTRLPVPLRLSIGAALRLQVLAVTGIVGIYFASRMMGTPLIGVTASLIGLGVVTWRTGLFSRQTLGLLRQN
jgi:O-antigen/teichoic acid export membrane protein